MKHSLLENTLYLQIRAYGLPEPEREYRFDPNRRWRADFCWIREPGARNVIVECNGGLYRKGGHNSLAGIQRDYEKGNAAQLAGFIYLQYDAEAVRTGRAVDEIRNLLWTSN